MRKPAFAIWAAIAVLALPASASGDIIGSDLSGSGIGTSCNVVAGCVVVQERIGGEYVEVIPPNAVITSWTTRGARRRMALRAYRHRPDLDFTPGELHVTKVGQSADQTGNGAVQTFPTRIPVKQGDYIALLVADGGSHGFSQTPPPDTVAFRVSPTQLDSLNPESLELWLQARVEPDVDADGFGDETQDPCLGCGGPAIKPPPAPDRFAAIRRQGPKVSIAGRARVSRRGIAAVRLTNPYAFEVRGRLTLTVGRKKVGTKKYSLPAKASKAVGVKVRRSTYRQIKRRRSLRVIARATAKAAAGPTRRVKKKVKLLAAKNKRPRRRARTPAPSQPTNANATFTGKTEQGFDITIKTSADGRALSTFATTARTSLCLVGGSASNPQIVNILPPLPIPLNAAGSFAIDAPNRAEDYDPNYRIQGRLTGGTISGTFAWRRSKAFADESCVTKELRFSATRR